jgi:hypothetical protein
MSNILAWYQNYSNLNPNKETSPNVSFAAAGPPTAPRNLTVNDSVPSQLTVSYVIPDPTDSINNNNVLPIENYTVSYSNTSVSPVRYPLPTLVPSTGTLIRGGTITSVVLTPLYPETPYSVSVTAKNTSNPNQGPPATTPTPITTTSPLVSDNPISSLTFPFVFVTGNNKKVINDVSVGNLTISNTRRETPETTVPINRLATRGQLGPGDIMKVTSRVVNDSITTTGPELQYQGFGGAAPTQSTSGNITLTPVRITDKYSASADYNKGFYQNATLKVALETGIFVASPTEYTVSVTQNFSGNPSTTASSSFYYDSTSGNPTVNSGQLTLTLKEGTFQQISGVWCAVQNPVKVQMVTNGVGNMGTYFYKEPLVSYLLSSAGISLTQTTTGTSSVTSGKVGDRFTGPIDISKELTWTAGTSFFSDSITVAATHNSISGSTSASKSLSVQMDYKSASTANRPSTIQDIVYDTYTNGCRVYSASSYSGFNVPDYVYQNQQYSNILYNNSWDIRASSIPYVLPSGTVTIDARNELQLTNDVFTTKSNPIAYRDYRPTYYYEGGIVQNNTLDYSGITTAGYRYVTFAWNIPTTREYASLEFRLNGTTSTLPIVIPIEKFQLYYRLEQNSSPFPTDSSSYSSIWADGNSLSGTPPEEPPFQNGTYWGYGTDVPDVVRTGFVTNPTNPTPSSLSIPVFLPTLRSDRSAIRLYCRIGLSMDTNFGFSSVSAKLS